MLGMSEPPKLVVSHSAGFFSCTTIFLEHILSYYNQHHLPPYHIDSTNMYTWYRPHSTLLAGGHGLDIKTEYFLDQDLSANIPSYQEGSPPICTTNVPIEQQYVNYRHLNYAALRPFIQRYFTPSPTIQLTVQDLMDKYDMDVDNTCVLFYRGNDKAKETTLPNYDQYLQTARSLLRIQPTLRFLVQSDETEFLDTMKAEFPDNHVIFYDEIRHMSRNPLTTVDRIYYQQNHLMSKFYLAITLVMSRCKYVVCGSGNCSLWIALFRGNSDGITQFNAWSSYTSEKN